MEFTPDKLAAFLLTVRALPKLQRVEQLVRDMNAIDEFARDAGYPSYFLVMGALGGRRPSKDLEDRLLRTWTFFERLRISVFPSQPDKRGWISSYSLPDLKLGTENVRSNIRIIGFVIWKAAVVGTLRSIRECRHCQLWFAAKKKDHKSCSDECREKEFRTTDAGRAKRAAYMKRYRANLLRLEREVAKTANRKSPK